MAKSKQKQTETKYSQNFADRLDNIRGIISNVERSFGKGALMLLGEAVEPEPVKTVSTGSLGLDVALGVGGIPKGRVVEIFGPESSGKTTLTLHAIASMQKAGGVCAFVDAEHALDLRYAQKLGVIPQELLVSQPDHGEQALEIVESLVRSDAIDMVVVDSVAALTPKAEIEGEMGDSHMGLQARLMSQALRKLTAAAAKQSTALVFINQVRQKIGVMFGNPEVTTGGNALKFYSSIRIDIRRIGTIKNGENAIGNRTRAKVVKNKMAPPFQDAEFDVMYGRGICNFGELIDHGVKHELIQKSGSWYHYNEKKLGQGRERVKECLQEDGALCLELDNAIREKILPTNQAEAKRTAA